MSELYLLTEAKKHLSLVGEFELIGSGGQKKVYKGTDGAYGDVVLKLIELHSDNTLQRAMRELDIASRLDGDEYPKLYNFDYLEVDHKKFLFVLEEHINGRTLRDYINEMDDRDRVLDAIRIGKELLKGLNKVHAEKLVHRDIKPENIIIDSETVYLLDFGIARDLDKESLTADLAIFGPMTIGYAAPEQVKNQKKLICNRTDLFSWGIIMYEMISGFNPLLEGANSREEVLTNTLTKKIHNLNSGYDNVDFIVKKCLEKPVHRRPSSAVQTLKILGGDD